MNEREIKSRVAEGWIHFRAIIEVAGIPKEHVKETLAGHMKKIEENKSLALISKKINPPKKEEEYFVAFAEAEALVKNTKELISFCFYFMPSHIEILDPEQMMYDMQDMADFLNDLQARLHAVNIGIQDYQQKNANLVKNTTTIISNFIMWTLHEPRTLAEMSKITGIKGEELEKLLAALEKEKKVHKKGEKYSLKNG